MKIVFEGKTKKGNDLVIRYIEANDAQAALDYINTLSQEQTFITFQGEQLKLEDEEKFVKSCLEVMSKKMGVTLVALCNGKFTGMSSVDMKNRVLSHVGGLGISVAKESRGEGVGKIFIENVISEAKKSIPNLKIIKLEVFANNPNAINLYKKVGFKEWGILPKAIFYKGEYIDEVSMYKEV
ncbi:MAG: GNAT family protein [Patescibacteria group bacterium]